MNKAVNPLTAYYNTKPIHITINSSDIISAQPYQRPVYPAHVREIISKFDPVLFAEPLVSMRDKKYYLVDGQNRIAALVAMNHGNPVDVRCTVFGGMSEATEANKFGKQDKLNRKLTPFEYINASAHGDDADSKKTRAFLEACAKLNISIKPARCADPRAFNAANTLLKAYIKHGEDTFCRVINLILDTWGGDWDSKSISFLNAMFAFDKKYRGQYSGRRFIKSCSKLVPGKILSVAHSMDGTMTDCLCLLFVSTYNKNVAEPQRI